MLDGWMDGWTDGRMEADDARVGGGKPRWQSDVDVVSIVVVLS